MSESIDYLSLFEQMDCSIFILEKVAGVDDFLIRSVSDPVEGFDGISRDVTVGRRLSSVYPNVTSQNMLCAALRVWRSGKSESVAMPSASGDSPVDALTRQLFRLDSGHVAAVCPKQKMAAIDEPPEQAGHSCGDNFLQAAPIGMGIVENRVFIDVNPVFCDLVGYSRAELIGQLSRLVYPDDATYEKAGSKKYRQILRTGSGTVETCMRRKDGGLINVILSSTSIGSDESKRVSLFTTQDISARIRSEQLIARAKEEWETTFDTMSDMVTIHDCYKRIVRVNKAAAGFIGLAPAAAVGQDYCQLFWQKINDCADCPMEKTITCGGEESRIVEHQRHGKILSVSTAPIASSSGRRLYIHVARDITEQKQQERILAARLRLSQSPDNDPVEGFLTQTLNEAEQLTNSEIGFFHFVDADGETLKLQAWSDRTSSEMCQIKPVSNHYPVSMAGVWCDCIRRKRSVIHNDYKTLADKNGLPDGHVPIVRELVVPVSRDGVIVAIVGVGNKETPYTQTDVAAVEQLADLAWDIIGKKKAQEELRKSEEQLWTFIDATPDTICFKDGNGRWLKANRARIDLLKLDDIDYFGKTDLELSELVDPAYRNVLLQCAEMDSAAWNKGSDFRCSYEVKTTNGEIRTYDMIKKPLFAKDGGRRGLIVLGRDVTEQKKLSEEANRSSRLAAIGELAAGVAHEINNPNALTLYNSELLATLFDDLVGILESRLAPDPDLELAGLSVGEGLREISQMLPAINDSARRIKRIVDDLRDFARQDHLLTQEQVDINSVVRASLRLTQNVIKKATDNLDVDLAEGLPGIAGDKSRIEQVVINLLVNACQALEDRSQRLSVRTQFDLNREQVDVIVTDEGCGISRENLERIQEPFMTTKRESGGTGLGLSVSSRIVQEHGGSLTFQSREGEGTQVRLALPALSEGGKI